MQHMEGDDDTEMKRKMEAMQKELNDKEEELQVMEFLNQALIVKERISNDELQGARKELINSFKDISTHSHIRVKRMGELDSKPFHTAAKKKYSAEEADEKAAELCSMWQDYLLDPSWHPFKILTDKICLYKPNLVCSSCSQVCSRCKQHRNVSSSNTVCCSTTLALAFQFLKILYEEDVKLTALKSEFVDEVYTAVATALAQMNEYNPSGGCLELELWNFKEGRKATLTDGVHYLLKLRKQISIKSNEKLGSLRYLATASILNRGFTLVYIVTRPKFLGSEVSKAGKSW
ncbi:hypothetical protein CRYUN_Cryun11dG0130800 [Craigia yunnanensis]